jgi:hypothetical protein
VDHRFGLWTITRNSEQAQKLYGSPKNPRNGANYAKIANDGQSSHNFPPKNLWKKFFFFKFSASVQAQCATRLPLIL